MNTRYSLYLAYSQRIIGAKCRSGRVRWQKSKLTYRHEELGSVKVREERIFRSAHCSLYLHYSQERKQKTYFIFFFPLKQLLKVSDPLWIKC